MIWVIGAVWMVALAATAWLYLRSPSRGRMIAYVVVGAAGLVPYLWLLWQDQLPGPSVTISTGFWVILAAASVAVARRRARTQS